MPRLLSHLAAELFRPRRFRYSIRALVIVVTLLALFLGLHVAPARRAQQAVEALQTAGCELRWSYQFAGGKYNPEAVSSIHRDFLSLFGPTSFHRVVELHCPQLDALHTRPAAAALAKHLPDLPRLTSVEISPGIANDDCLAAIGRLRHLDSLKLAGPNISDRGLAHLSRLTRLRTLALHSPKITDAGVAHLASLTKLRSLDLKTAASPLVSLPNQAMGFSLTLDREPAPAPPSTPAKVPSNGQSNTPASAPAAGLTNECLRTVGRLRNLVSLSVLSDGVSTAGLEHLRGLTRLESLQLSERTDAPAGTLAYLQSLTSLQRLSLFQTMFSHADVESLRRTNPKLTWILSRNLYVADGRVSEMPLSTSPFPQSPSYFPLPAPRPLPPRQHSTQ